MTFFKLLTISLITASLSYAQADIAQLQQANLVCEDVHYNDIEERAKEVTFLHACDKIEFKSESSFSTSPGKCIVLFKQISQQIYRICVSKEILSDK